MDESKYTLTEHLSELRGRLAKSLLAVIITSSVALFFADDLLTLSIEPLQKALRSKSRLETVVIDDDQARREALVARLDGDERIRLVGNDGDIEALGALATEAAKAKKPLDFVVVAASATDNLGTRAHDVLEGLEPQPHVVYLITQKDSATLQELTLDGISVMPAAPSPARLGREIRKAAAAAGKIARDDKLVVLSPLDPFFAYLKIGLVCGLFMACPVWLYQAWRFVAPGLYDKEKSVVGPAVTSASLLFIAGGAFAYFLMFPMMFDVMVNQMMPSALAASFTVDNYLSLLFTMTVAFGVVFELPLIIALLARVGLVTPEFLVKWRRYAIVLAFVIGAVLTPADPVSQIFMSIPLVVFYEVGIVLARIMAKKRRATAEAPDPADEAAAAS
jgi:sec-independent protein translocase protein TatC